uniref:Jacalin-type lectin domain-containing protein n=1 Tax=Phytophthora ramorum TaxID=164328 RepID=H3GEI4_PHYRM
MAWVKALFASLALIAATPGSNAVVVTKYGTRVPTKTAPTIIRGSGSAGLSGSASLESDEDISVLVEALSASASESGSASFADAFRLLSASGSGSWGSSRSSGSSEIARAPVVSSVDEVSVTVSSGSSSNYAATVTDGSGASYNIATALTAKSSVVPVYRNWVGPRTVQGDSACYREAHFMDVCPSGYDRNEATNTCWTECPIEFPVECGMECIRQNDDCGREIFYKVSSVFNVGINGVMDNWFGKFSEMAKGIRIAVMCSCMMVGEIRAILRYVRTIKTADPQASQDKILALLYQSNAVVVELPITIKLCLGGKAGPMWWLADRIMASTQFILSQILAHDDELVTSWSSFTAFIKGANFTAPPAMITKGEIGYLKDALKSNSTCGHDLQGLVERTWATVEALREQNPAITEDELRVKIQDTDLVKTDIAMVTSNCMELMISQSDEDTAYTTRDKLRKTFGVIINDLITTGKSDNGTSYKAKEYAYKVVNQGLNMWVVTGFDMSGVSSFISEYFQSICGPTQFMGEIDDGTDPDTLGLNTIQKAFQNSTMLWTKKGDGQVIINFTSYDTKNVTVNIFSGGDKVDEVDVAAGGKAQWKSNVTAMGGRTLYLDRWRPGFLGLPGTGGGSLMLWVPHAAQGGHLDLNARLNVS